MTTGRIKKIVRDKAFGFISADDFFDYFLHASDLFDVALDELEVGSAVRFLATDGPKGPRARSVERV